LRMQARLLFLMWGLLAGVFTAEFGMECAGLPSTCVPVPAENLTFCFTGINKTVVEAHHTDLEWAQALPSLDMQLQTVWPGVENLADSAGMRHGFMVCDDCLQAYGHMLCSALVPSCNFTVCAALLTVQIGECTGTCTTQIITKYSCTDLPSVCTARYAFRYSVCLAQCVAQILVNSPCASLALGRQMCTDLVDICLCNPPTTIANDICVDFSPSGYFIPFPDGLSCTDSAGWCNQPLDEGANIMCTNANLCLTVEPNPTDPNNAVSNNPASYIGGASSLLSSSLFFQLWSGFPGSP